MNFWQGKNVLVTGASGFIGSWLAKALIERNAQVTTIVRDLKKKSNLDILNIREKINIIKGDITDYDLVLRVLNEFEIDTCFHLAAQSIAQTAEKSPLSTLESNIKGTWILLEASKNYGIERMIVASSDKAYGKQKEFPYNEDCPLLGRNPYDASKICADVLAQTYASTYNFPVAITRNVNVYGPGDLNFSRLIPGTIISILKNDTPVIRSDGTPERDYMYIEDAVNAYIILAENLHRPEVKGEAFNFGSGKPIKVLDLFNMIIKLSGKNLIPKIMSEAKNEIDRQYLATTKAERVLGWKPKWTFEEGLKKTIEWYQENLPNLGV